MSLLTIEMTNNLAYTLFHLALTVDIRALQENQQEILMDF